MFAVIHDGITVKDKDGNVYPGVIGDRRRNHMWVRFEEGLDLLPVLEHGQRYIVTVFNDGIDHVFIATFRADDFSFHNGAWWSVNEVKGFAPIPQMIEI